MALSRQKPVRALVIGAGPAGVAMHLPELARLRDAGAVTLTVVADLQTGRAAAARCQFGFEESCADARSALERDDIDAVYILASAQLHHAYGLAALQSGKHLFVEKPVAPSYVDASELARVARAQGLIAVGAHNRRFYRAMLEARRRTGSVRWRYAEAVFHKPEFGKPAPFGARTWLGANGIHALDALVFMMGGLPERLTALTSGTAGEPASQFSALMSWPDGAQGLFLCNNDSGARREEYVFHMPGETCAITDGGLTVTKDDKTVERLALPCVGDGIAAEHAAFIAAIRGDGPPAHAIDAIAPSLFLAELIESGFSGAVSVTAQVPRELSFPRRLDQGGAVLVTHASGLQAALARHLCAYRLVSAEDVESAALPRRDIVAAILGRGSSALPAGLLVKLPALRVVGVAALSLARHAPETLLERGITLVNASSAYADSVAEFALGLAILARRRAFSSHELMRKRGWGSRLPAPGLGGQLQRAARYARPAIARCGFEALWPKLKHAVGSFVKLPHAAAGDARELRGARVGLIGWGSNARAFAERLVQARAHVVVYSEHAMPDDITRAGATPVSLAEALAADVVSLHRGLSTQTRHFMGTAELGRLRPGTVLINIARGALIEPRALLARLKRGDIFACLDTYELEPLPSSHPLRRLPNVFLTSHIAGGSADMHAAAADEVVRKVASVLASAEHGTEVVSAQRLRTMT